jgi:AraC family transcriptional regulator
MRKPRVTFLPCRGGLSSWQKRRTLELLNDDCIGNIALAQIARECRLSVSHFARSFKISFGMPVHRWIVGQRVERAKDLLVNSKQPLVDVAFTAGFSDQASFNRTFTKVIGLSPGRWRRHFIQ